MSHSCPGSELSLEQLVRAFSNVLIPNSPLRSDLFDLEPQKLYSVERNLTEVLHAIRAIRNKYVPINKLPPEILSKIFEYRSHEWPLVGATHVCRYWRSVLISSPPLWTCFQFHSVPDLNRTLTYLERSKAAPIDVLINTGYADSPQEAEVLKQLAPHIARTKSLVIQGTQDIRAASLLFCDPAPSLRYLNLYSREGYVRLPEEFLGRQAPLLNSIVFSGICPTFESPFPLPNLTEFSLYISEDAGPIRMGALFRFLSGSPQLQKIRIGIYSLSLQDTPLDDVILLESLEELDYDCNLTGRTLTHLRLPRLEKFRASSTPGPGQTQKLVDLLPHNGRTLLANATKMMYYSANPSLGVDFSGNEAEISLRVVSTTGDPPTVDWFSDQTCIPFGQIEDLTIESSPLSVIFPVSVFVLENLTVLRVTLWDTEFTEGCLRLFHPDPEAGVPCRSLQRIECACWGFPQPVARSLINLVRERKQAGHELSLLGLLIEQDFDQGLVEELKEHVGRVRMGGEDART